MMQLVYQLLLWIFFQCYFKKSNSDSNCLECKYGWFMVNKSESLWDLQMWWFTYVTIVSCFCLFSIFRSDYQLPDGVDSSSAPCEIFGYFLLFFLDCGTVRTVVQVNRYKRCCYSRLFECVLDSFYVSVSTCLPRWRMEWIM